MAGARGGQPWALVLSPRSTGHCGRFAAQDCMSIPACHKSGSGGNFGYFRRPGRIEQGCWPWKWIEADKFKSGLERRIGQTW